MLDCVRRLLLLGAAPVPAKVGTNSLCLHAQRVFLA